MHQSHTLNMPRPLRMPVSPIAPVNGHTCTVYILQCSYILSVCSSFRVRISHIKVHCNETCVEIELQVLLAVELSR